jgi:hypothetical protein
VYVWQGQLRYQLNRGWDGGRAQISREVAANILKESIRRQEARRG